MVEAGLTDEILTAVSCLTGEVAPDTLSEYWAVAGRQLQAAVSVVPSQPAVLQSSRGVEQHSADCPQQGLLLTPADVTDK